MAGPLDILRGLSGGGGGKSSPSASTGFDANSAKILADVSKHLKAINKLVKSGKGDWKNYARADSLQKAGKATANFHKAQKDLNNLLKKGNAGLKETASAYRNLASAQKEAKETVAEANFEMNETKGVAGRFKNVLDDMAKHKGPVLLAAAIKDLSLVTADMTQNFGHMASRGQVANMTMGQLASTTATYSMEMRLAMLNAAAMGISADDSNAAFSRLTTTYGGNAAAVEDLGNKWRDIANIATVSGLGMEEVSLLADQGMKRLGETIDDTMNSVVQMSKATGEMNNRWGAAAPTAQQMSKSVRELAYSAGFYNQNTSMVIDTLSREVSMQLALGRSREAAVQKAQKNLEMAGKVNIVGITAFRNDIQTAFDNAADKQAYMAKLTKEFGSEGEIIANMLQHGTLQSSETLFAFEKAVKNSSKLQANMMDKFRNAAASGDINAMLGVGIGIDEAQYMIQEAQVLTAKLAKIRDAQGGANTDAAVKAVFGKDSSPKVKEFTAKLRAGGMSNKEMSQEFRKLTGTSKQAGKLDAPGAAGKQDWRAFAESATQAGWFAGITGLLGNMVGLLGQLPGAIVAASAMLGARGMLGGALGNLGAGRGAALGRGAAKMGGKLGGMAKGAGRMAAGAARGAAGGAMAGLAIADMVHNAYNAMGEASRLFGKDAAVKDAFGVWAGKTLDHLSMGFLSFTDEELKGLARGSLETPLTMIGNALGGLFGDDGNSSSDSDKTRAEFEHAKSMGWSSASGGISGYKAVKAQRAAQAVAQTKANSGAQMATPKTSVPNSAPPGRDGGGGGGTAVATGSVSGGSLILEVPNWESVFAHTQNELVGKTS